MVDQFLYNSRGEWIAFRVGKNIFNTNGNWIGWMPWDDTDVVTPDGKYLGTICVNDRFYYFRGKPYRGYPGYPGYPGYAGYSPLPPGAEDIKILKGE